MVPTLTAPLKKSIPYINDSVSCTKSNFFNIVFNGIPAGLGAGPRDQALCRGEEEICRFQTYRFLLVREGETCSYDFYFRVFFVIVQTKLKDFNNYKDSIAIISFLNFWKFVASIFSLFLVLYLDLLSSKSLHTVILRT